MPGQFLWEMPSTVDQVKTRKADLKVETEAHFLSPRTGTENKLC